MLKYEIPHRNRKMAKYPVLSKIDMTQDLKS
jgi:hypothetical protein